MSPTTGTFAAWTTFPATREPRPIVLLEDVTPGQGFSSGESKLAFGCGMFATSLQLPTTATGQATAIWKDGSAQSFPSVSAREGLKAMAAAQRDTNPGCSSVAPLNITRARLGLETYLTDRGVAQITSWLFTAPGSWREIAYPALAPPSIWQSGWSEWSGDFATVTRDGLSITFGFTGAKPGNGPCDGNYRASVTESSTAVAVVPMALLNPNQDGIACTGEGYPRSLTVSLHRPLGNRVLVNRRAAVLAVCAEMASCDWHSVGLTAKMTAKPTENLGRMHTTLD
jgi:hypothetical protein